VSPVKACRFFFRMLTTSLAVHPQSPISTSSMGLFALFSAPASIPIEWPLIALPSNLSAPVHLILAVICEDFIM
jgi:hypothetical protein